ncbi:MAG: chorismate mutase [Alphaproteobacteria bacterium]
MVETGDNASTTLRELREHIDALDETMQRLLIERSSVIDALISAKGTAASGMAFRPQREAEMMRQIVERHSGNLPLATVEHLWREIISTFTYMQAPFRLVVHYGSDPVAIHDLARFAFGFSVDLVRAESPEEVVETVTTTGSDLGLIPIENTRFEKPWWQAMRQPGEPKVIALWPFIAGKGIPADAPAVVIAPPLSEPTVTDFAIFSATDNRALGSPIAGSTLIADCEIEGGREVLVAIKGQEPDTTLRDAGMVDAYAVGSVAKGLTLSPGGNGLRNSIHKNSP